MKKETFWVGKIRPAKGSAAKPGAVKQTKAENLKVLKEQIGDLEANLLSPFIFHYTRDIKDVRLLKRINQFERVNQDLLEMKEGETVDDVLTRFDNYIKKLELLLNQM